MLEEHLDHLKKVKRQQDAVEVPKEANEDSEFNQVFTDSNANADMDSDNEAKAEGKKKTAKKVRQVK